MQFSRLSHITGKYIAEDILKSLEDLGIPVEDMRGHGYDGAPTISSQRVGVQARIRECLHLYCALPEVRNVQVLDKLKNFFQKNAKKNGLL